MHKATDNLTGSSRLPTNNSTEVEDSRGADGPTPGHTMENGRRPSEIEIEKPGTPTDDDSSFSSAAASVTEEDGRIVSSSGAGPEQRLKISRSITEVRDGIENRRDVELGGALEKQPTPRYLADPNLVTFEDDDPGNPKTWKYSRKWAAVFVVSTFTLISPISSTMTAPALGSIAAELNITTEIEKELSLSIFVLGENSCALLNPASTHPICGGEQCFTGWMND